MKIAVSTDHAGFEPLQKLIVYLESLGHECISYGPSQYDPQDDYPDFIKPAAQAVAQRECQMGIIFGSSGEGEAIVANRYAGVRCGVFYGPIAPVGVVDADGHTASDNYEILRLNRQHNDANMLSLAGRFLTYDQVEQAVSIWLSTPFSGIERHQRRIDKIDN